MDRRRILLVEDNALVIDALRLLLEETGRDVAVAATVAEAVAACRASAPDLMLLDLTLPDGDGLAVLAALRAEGHTPPTTAALTGHDDPETTQRCVEAGCVGVVVKPFRVADLLGRVEGWLGGE